MLDAQYLVWLVVFLALAFDYINGFHDTANAIATSVSTRAIEPKKAIMMTAALNFLGAMVSTGVAKTIGGDIVNAKKTLLLLYTLEQLQGEDLKRLQEILTYTPEERRAYIDEVRALYDKAGTRLYAEAEIERLTAEAYHGVEQLPLREEGLELLLSLFHTLSGRTK